MYIHTHSKCICVYSIQYTYMLMLDAPSIYALPYVFFVKGVGFRV